MSYAFRQQYRFQSLSGRLTYAVQWLILANVAVYALQVIADIFIGAPVSPQHGVLGPPGGRALPFLMFSPRLLLSGWVWQPFTYMFLHDGLWHLVMNMVGLYFFGPEVERVLSTRQFFRFYILCGAGAVLATLVPFFLLPGYDTFVLGASGACMAVLMAFAVIAPEREVFILPLPVPIPVRTLVVLIIILSLIAAIGPSNVSIATHLGGLFLGFVYMKAAPKLRVLLDQARGKGRQPRDPDEALGEAVDNILRFRDRKEQGKRNRKP